MGFECSINKIPRCIDTSCSSIECIMAQKYQHYKYIITHEPFYARRVKAAEEKGEEYPFSFDSFTGDIYKDKYEIPTDKILHAFYADYYSDNSGSPDETIDYWCSIGRGLDDEICTILRQNKVTGIDNENSQYILSEAIIDQLITLAEEWLEKNKLHECVAKYGIVRKEDGQLLYVPIDGIEVTSVDEDFSKKLFFDEDYCDSIFVRKTATDSETYCMWEDFHKALLTAKSIMEDYIITYERSW